MPVPYMTFQPYNPVGTAISSYSAISDALRAQKDAKMKQQMMPYQMQSLENQLALQQSELEMNPYKQQELIASIAKSEREADKERQVAEYLSRMLSGQGGSSGGPSDLGDIYARKLAGLPEQTPQEKFNMDAQLHLQKQILSKQIEQEMGTTTHLGAKQKMKLGVENAMPILDELIEFDVPGQSVGKHFSWDKQPKYESMVSNITDKIVAALDLPKTDSSLKMAEKMVRREPRESLGSYKERLNSLKGELSGIYERVSGSPYKRTGGTVRMKGPNGKVYNVPEDQVKAAMAAGGERV